jgi:hypothetical protein
MYPFNRKVLKGYFPLEFCKEVPQKWEELSANDLRALAKGNFLIRDLATKKFYLVCHFLNIPFFVFAAMSRLDVIHVYEHVSELMGENSLSKTLIKKVRVGFKAWIGPEDKAANISFLEFIKADTCYVRFIRTNDLKYLNELVATLYRPERTDLSPDDESYRGDMRVPFNEYHVAEMGVLAGKIRLIDRYAILLQYSGLRNWLQQRYEKTFSGTGSSKHGWAGVIISLAGEKFGDDDQVSAKFLHAILTHLEMSQEEIEKYKS